MATHLYADCRAATMTGGENGVGLIEDAVIAVRDGRIEWIGAASEAPVGYAQAPRASLGGRLVTPGFIDCHTHLVFGGDRAAEFERRQCGASYEEIARAGGGIMSTVRATRSASDEELRASALARLDRMIACGATCVEVKSGYGLAIDDELRLLRIARALERDRQVKIVTTWLAAHAIPKDFDADADAYIERVAIPGLVRAAEEGLVDQVDAYCEKIAFDTAQVSRLFEAAASLGLPVKLHAEQLSDMKGARLAARHGALSVDHLEYLDTEDIPALADAGCVAVLLPGAFYFLRETKKPPVAALRRAGVPIAVATDCNPGTSPMISLPLAMNMACVLFGLTPAEALAGVTINAARALGLGHDLGRIAPGYRAELAVWNARDPAALAYEIGVAQVHQRVTQWGGPAG